MKAFSFVVAGLLIPGAIAAEVIVLRGATLIDGTGAPPVVNAVIVVDGGKIRAAGPAARVKIPASAEVLDFTGKFIIPGLVDLHTHPPPQRELAEKVFRTYLYFGVTTIRSMGVDGDDIWKMREAQRSGKLIAPRIFTAGQGFGHPKGWPVNPNVHRPTNPEEARAQVRLLAAKGADLVKMWVDSKDGRMPKFDMNIASAVIDEAARHNLPAAAHIFEYEDSLQLAKLGLSEFIHMVRDRDVLPPEFLSLVKQRRITFAPTMAKMEGDFFFAENPRAPQLDDPEYAALMGADAIRRLRSGPAEGITAEILALRKKDFHLAKKHTRRLFDDGVLVGIASDGPVFPVAHGHGTHVEMRILNECGIAPLQVIRAATLNGARRLTMGLNGKGKREFGTIEPGMAADLLVLSADPLAAISNTRKIEKVMQSGHWIERGPQP